jgi:hypothetical protein
MPVMNQAPWFKHWAAKSITSTTLMSLTDHEERVWWRLLAQTSINDPRWEVGNEPRALAPLCASTPPKFTAAVRTFEAKGMVVVDGDTIRIANAGQYQETPDAARMRKMRDRQREAEPEANEPVTSPVTVTPSVTPLFRQEDRGKKIEPPNGGSAPDGARRRKDFKPLTDDQHAKLRRDFSALSALDDRIAEARAHVYAAKYIDEYMYLRGWLRRDLERLPQGRQPVPGGRSEIRIVGAEHYDSMFGGRE